MHPFLTGQLAALHQSDLRAEADAARSGRRAARHGDGDRLVQPAEIVIRRATSADGPALAALSALDEAPMPFGPALVAEIGGVPAAALPLDGGRAFGDPFRPTAELIALLELRAAQIRTEEAGPDHRRGLPGFSLPSSLRRLV